jgi:hypothetical protein
MTRQSYSLDQIKAMLTDRAADVAEAYAPRAPGAYVQGDEYWTLNPSRADRSVGSFVIWISGPRAGRWCDFAMGGREGHGDLLDLIAMSLNVDIAEAIREARRFLGLMHERPEDIAMRKAAADRRARQLAEARAQDAERAQSRARGAKALWLSAQPQLRGTPVDHYLRQSRGIDLSALGRQPAALRYHPALRYTHTDPKTGEVIEGTWPALVSLINDLRGNAVAVHRTWIAYDGARGAWVKAPVPAAKKVLGDYRGAAIHIARGTVGAGPRGGRPPALRDAPPGTHVYVSEGIEDALSVCMLLPHVRVLAAVSLSNLGALALPAGVTRITLVADRDEGEQAQAALERAVLTHAQAGREVRLWQPDPGCKDLNDALRAMAAQNERAG